MQPCASTHAGYPPVFQRRAFLRGFFGVLAYQTLNSVLAQRLTVGNHEEGIIGASPAIRDPVLQGLLAFWRERRFAFLGGHWRCT